MKYIKPMNEFFFNINESLNIVEIETFLPVFSGFYNTIEGSVIDDIIDDILNEEDLNYDDVTFDYKEAHISLSRNMVDLVNTYVKDILTSASFEFQSLYSPRYYNYSNDSINVILKVDRDEFISVMEDNKDELVIKIRDEYTSSSGFSSNHSNDYDDWLNDFIKNGLNHDSHKAGAIINMLFEIYDNLDDSTIYEYLITSGIVVNYEINK